jgi:hypothetical protein
VDKNEDIKLVKHQIQTFSSVKEALGIEELELAILVKVTIIKGC